ncbi:MAG: hypothetical protein LBL99_02455 [Holosporaceae bacterium]|jgi:hypothetical protein|nr:hypothetical protein [Holosporaceae bacterium]
MLSKQSLDILIDLVEIKLSAIMILDKDDVREVQRLKNCKNELLDFKRTTYVGKKIRSGGNATAAAF